MGSLRAPSSRVFIITVSLCYLVALFEGFDLQAAGVAAPKLGPAFHIKSAQLGWFFSSSTFGLMLGAAIGGRLSDRLGRKPILIASVAVFGLMSVATGLAPNFATLFVARFLTGLGIGGGTPRPRCFGLGEFATDPQEYIDWRPLCRAAERGRLCESGGRARKFSRLVRRLLTGGGTTRSVLQVLVPVMLIAGASAVILATHKVPRESYL